MVTSAGYPANSVENLEFNTLLDGLFHASTYLFVALGLFLLWRTAHKSHLWWSGKMLVGTMLMGFGIFNLVEGLVNHNLLGLHHVNETVPREQWIYWDIGFLVWGALMLDGGWLVFRSGKRESPGEVGQSTVHPACTVIGRRRAILVPLQAPGNAVVASSPGRPSLCGTMELLSRPVVARPPAARRYLGSARQRGRRAQSAYQRP